MRIGIDCRLPYYQMGGISQYILHLLPALAALDHQNDYLLFHSRKDGRSYLPPQAVNFQRRDLWTPAHHRLERIALAAEIAPHRLDLFHSPDFIPPGGGRWLRQQRRRHVITVHDLNFVYYPEFLTPESLRYYAGQIAWAVQEADGIAADSEATRRDLIQRRGVAPEKVTTIHLAANPHYTRPVEEAALRQTLQSLNLSPGFLLYVGTLEPRKNVPLLLRAYSRLRREHSLDRPLLLVGGKGWIYDEIFATIGRLELADHVRHLERISNETLAHLYTAAGLLALPSFYEGFGLPVLEAMHCGCPVVASNHGSLPEVGGTAAWLLDPEDESAWVAALSQVLAGGATREKMIADGRRQAARFTWSKTAAATLDLYRRAVA
jgi:glycosyltransferase involved in cell wall biosynthesis